MANYAKIVDGVVENVIVANADWVALQTSDTYVLCDVNSFVSVGSRFINGVFTYPKPFPSWSLDSNNNWKPPVAKPEGDLMWDESTLSWVAIPVG